MLKNYLTIAIRSMMRNKVYSIINITGLSVGIGCCLMLALYIQDEARFDRHHKDVERIYRVTSIMGDPSENKVMRTSSPPIVWGIKDELPEVETVTRLVNPPGVSQNLIRYEDKQFYEPNGFIADSTLFDMFTYKFIEGNPKKALVEANSIVITEEMAKKLFGNQPALNKIITVDQAGPVGDFKITGVLAAKQGNSEINANFFVSMTSSGWGEYLRSPGAMDQWAGQNFMLSYLKLRPGHTPEEFIPKMNKVFLKHAEDNLKTLGMKKQLGLDAVQDIYLYKSYGGSSPRITYVYVVASIAAFILLIACINFMNLSTAKATKRAGEVGVRKTMGAFRSSLIAQFLGEALLIVGVSIIIGLGIVQLALPLFNQLTSKQIGFGSENLLFIFGALIAIAILTGVIAGSYPALYLSSFQPAKVLKGKIALNNSGGMLRKSLVVVQFVVAIMLASGMIMISKQLRFMQERDLGFDSKTKVVLPLRSAIAHSNFSVLQNELSKIAAVKSSTGANYLPGSPIWNDFSLYPAGSDMEHAVMIKNVRVEPNFLPDMKIKFLAGRNFSEDRASDTRVRIIINKTAAKRLGFEPNEIVGQSIYTDHSTEKESFEVIGVIDDYHHLSLKQEIFPLAYFLSPTNADYPFMVVSLEMKNINETLEKMEKVWRSVNPNIPFEYNFLDENVKKQYDDDKKIAGVISTFTIIAMIICCMGLYGLSSYMAERRFKEIGVRKVLGATINQIVGMMSGEFVKLVLIAFIIAVPLSWYAMNTWLESFAYKVPVTVSIFSIAGVSALAIALLTVSFESIRAAASNPVKALRNE
jgi:putative ABC transport system permease protein